MKDNISDYYDSREYFRFRTLVPITKEVLEKGRKNQGEVAAKLMKMWYQRSIALGNLEVQSWLLERSIRPITRKSSVYKEKHGKLRRDYFTVIENIIKKEQILNIFFDDTLPKDNKKRYDVSSKKNDSVELWLEKNGIGFDLHLWGKGTIEAPVYSDYLFSEYKNVKKILFNTNFDTTNVKNMSGMFSYCWKLEELDLKGFDTRNTQDMSWMFYGCRELKKIDIMSFDTSNVQDMAGMFNDCEHLEGLDVKNFNTSKVRDMSWMFYGCEQLQELDVRNFDTSSIEDIVEIFDNCPYIERFQGAKEIKGLEGLGLEGKNAGERDKLL